VDFEQPKKDHHRLLSPTDHTQRYTYIIMVFMWLLPPLFIRSPLPLWEAPTFAFLTQFGVYERFLVARLLPYPKFLNIKAIKWMDDH
jgi:hypothetical protein